MMVSWVGGPPHPLCGLSLHKYFLFLMKPSLRGLGDPDFHLHSLLMGKTCLLKGIYGPLPQRISRRGRRSWYWCLKGQTCLLKGEVYPLLQRTSWRGMRSWYSLWFTFKWKEKNQVAQQHILSWFLVLGGWLSLSKLGQRPAGVGQRYSCPTTPENL